ncbi:unnamed protein product, partial [Mesorhabditis spiculigera]
MNQSYSYTGQSGQPGSSQQTASQASYSSMAMRGLDDKASAYTFQPTGASYSAAAGQPGSSSTASYIPGYGQTELRLVNSHGEHGEHRYIINQPGSEDKLTALIDSYFVDVPSQQGQQSSWNHGQHSAQSYLGQPGTIKDVMGKLVAGVPELSEKERAKKERQAEAARLRYHALSADKKKELNAKRTEAQRRKRQREKELEQLEDILRQTNDIQEDPDITEQLREKRRRARWAEAARLRYQRMTPEQKADCNERRKRREHEKAFNACKAQGLVIGNDPMKDNDIVVEFIKTNNKKKAEAARNRYHSMSNEQKRAYNQKRTDAFRRKRLEEEMLLTMPIGRVSGEVFDRAQQIVERNRKRAEAARLRYQRMTPDQRKRAAESARSRYQRMSADQRKQYNQKRYSPKKGGGPDEPKTHEPDFSTVEGDFDALSSIERDVMKRTQQAQQTLRRKQLEDTHLPHSHRMLDDSGSSATYVLSSQPQLSKIGHQQPQTLAQLKQGTSVQHVLGQQSSYPGNIVVITAPSTTTSNPYAQHRT